MIGIIAAIAGFFGISIFRLVAYAAIATAVVAGGLTIRHHYVALGYEKALEAVAKQNEITRDAADKIGMKADKCAEGINGYWDIVTQSCKLEDAK